MFDAGRQTQASQLVCCYRAQSGRFNIIASLYDTDLGEPLFSQYILNLSLKLHAQYLAVVVDFSRETILLHQF